MRFEGLDLNLLVALDALLAEGNVSVAADRVFLSQSAMSGALARLRDFFQDEILIPSGRRMILTPRAEQLAGPVRAALLQIKATITTRPEFEPGECARQFTILASDYTSVVALSEGLRRIQPLAPKMTFRILGIDGSATARIEAGEADILIVLEQHISNHHPSELLYEDDYVVVAWAHSAAVEGAVTDLDYFTLGHVIVDFGDRSPVFDTWYLESGQRSRRVEVIATNFTTVPYLLIGTDRIATMHRRLALLFAEILPLKIYPVPFDLPGIRQMIQWHSIKGSDPATMWVRDRLHDVFSKSITPPTGP